MEFGVLGERQAERLHLLEHGAEVGQAGAVQGLDGAERGIVGLPGLLVRHRQVADRAGAAELLAELHQLGAGLGEGLGLGVLILLWRLGAALQHA